MQRRAEEHLYWDETKLNCNKKKKKCDQWYKLKFVLQVN